MGATRVVSDHAGVYLPHVRYGKPVKEVVVGAVIRKDDRVLLVQQRKIEAFGLWGYPGGHVEAGESLEEALGRELREETSLELVESTPLRINRKGNNFEHHAFLCSVEGDVTLQHDELIGYGWFSRGDIASMRPRLRARFVFDLAKQALSEELVAVVNENDNVMLVKPRSNLKDTDIFRVSSLWIENSKGEVLLQQRALDKKNGGGQWGPAAAGTVEAHETYLANIRKEASEEIGLTGITPIEVDKRLITSPYARFVVTYRAQIDKPIEEFKIQKSEVAAIKWVKKSEILEDLAQDPKKYVPSAEFWKELFF
jgi:ADP-ribose pyrophosphatase YjhB (NUDIX family)